MAKKKSYSRKHLPKKGIQVAASAGNRLTRIHLDAAEDGVSLALVGAASASLSKGNRHVLTLRPAESGISLSLVGAASAAQ